VTISARCWRARVTAPAPLPGRSGDGCRRGEQCTGHDERAESEQLGASHTPAHHRRGHGSGADDGGERLVVLGFDILRQLRERAGVRQRLLVGEDQRVVASSGSIFSTSSRTPSTGDTYCTQRRSVPLHRVVDEVHPLRRGVDVRRSLRDDHRVGPRGGAGLGNTNRNRWVVAGHRATSPDQPIVAAKLPFNKSSA